MAMTVAEIVKELLDAHEKGRDIQLNKYASSVVILMSKLYYFTRLAIGVAF